MKQEIVYKSIKELVPYARNSRTHSDEQVAQIMASIKEFGFTNPILTDGENGIIAGHGRVMAAQRMGLDEVPTIELSHLTEAQKKAYIIADNKLALNSGWDEEMLAIEIQELQDLGYDLDLTGFSMDELLDMDINLEGTLEAVIDESKADDVPEVVENPVIKLGDLIELGNHRLLCGDSTNESDIEKLMGGVKSEMVFTDPPYLMDFTGGVHADGSKSFNSKHGAIKNDKMSKEDGNKFLDDVNTMIKKWNNGAFYITFYRLGIGQYYSSMDRVGLQTRALIIWNKGNHTLSNSDYMSKYEPIFYGWVKDHNFYGGKNGMDIWDIKRTAKNDLHPTMKPVELVEKAVFEGSKTKDIVLDLFGGSGTTMIACENLTRKARLMELDEKYAQVIIQRWCDYTQIDSIKINGIEVSWNDYKNSVG
jgi:DNA modification methylase